MHGTMYFQHNFMLDLDKDLIVGSFNFVFSGHHSLYYSLFLPPKNIFINLVIITDTTHQSILWIKIKGNSAQIQA